MVVTQQTENEQLRAQWQEANALVEHLRRQLADVTAQRDLLIAMCPAEKENAQLRAQLAQRTAALRALGAPRQFADQLCWCRTAGGVYCVGQPQCEQAQCALADRPEAPKGET